MNRNQKILLIIGAIALALLVTFFYHNQNSKVSNEQAIVNNSNEAENTQPTATITEAPTEQMIDASQRAFKTDAVMANGKRIFYSNANFGISFSYNTEVYTAPKIVADERTNAFANATYISMRDNSVAIGEAAPESPNIAIFKDQGYQNYLDEQIEIIEKNPECTIKSRANIGGNPAVRYSCLGMGDPETILVKHPQGFTLNINAAFPDKYFDELVNSIKILK